MILLISKVLTVRTKNHPSFGFLSVSGKHTHNTRTNTHTLAHSHKLIYRIYYEKKSNKKKDLGHSREGKEKKTVQKT